MFNSNSLDLSWPAKGNCDWQGGQRQTSTIKNASPNTSRGTSDDHRLLLLPLIPTLLSPPDLPWHYFYCCCCCYYQELSRWPSDYLMTHSTSCLNHLPTTTGATTPTNRRTSDHHYHRWDFLSHSCITTTCCYYCYNCYMTTHSTTATLLLIESVVFALWYQTWETIINVLPRQPTSVGMRLLPSLSDPISFIIYASCVPSSFSTADNMNTTTFSRSSSPHVCLLLAGDKVEATLVWVRWYLCRVRGSFVKRKMAYYRPCMMNTKDLFSPQVFFFFPSPLCSHPLPVKQLRLTPLSLSSSLTKSIHFFLLFLSSLTLSPSFFFSPTQGWLTQRTNYSLVSISAVQVLWPIERSELKGSAKYTFLSAH